MSTKQKTISKNNPDVRAGKKLLVYCPITNKPMMIVKRIPGGMVYESVNGDFYPIYKGSYKNFKYEWVKK